MGVLLYNADPNTGTGATINGSTGLPTPPTGQQLDVIP